MAVQQGLQRVKEIAVEKVNKIHDKEAPKFDAKFSTAPIFKANDPIHKWRPFLVRVFRSSCEDLELDRLRFLDKFVQSTTRLSL